MPGCSIFGCPLCAFVNNQERCYTGRTFEAIPSTTSSFSLYRSHRDFKHTRWTVDARSFIQNTIDALDGSAICAIIQVLKWISVFRVARALVQYCHEMKCESKISNNCTTLSILYYTIVEPFGTCEYESPLIQSMILFLYTIGMIITIKIITSFKITQRLKISAAELSVESVAAA